MHDALKTLVLTLSAVLTLGGCAKEGEPESRQAPPADLSGSPPATAAVQPSPSASLTAEAGSLTPPGFDVSSVRVVNPALGKFPYVGLIEGYRPSDSRSNKDVAFDRYEFFDGAKIITVEGRLNTTGALGTGASAFQVLKTYESLITGLGGVRVFEGKGRQVDESKLKFSDIRHRHPLWDDDQMGVYMVRAPDREIWVEAFVPEHPDREGDYYLTVVEKKALEVKASLLPAEEMKRELDAEGHVALYINFDFDKADIRPESQPIVDEIVKLLKNNPGLRLTVEGHTDNVGGPDYNKRLSDARARSVVAALTARGVEASRLKAAGFGQEKPIADNSTDSGRAQNRRVELVKEG